MSASDRDYYQARAEQELARARDATDLSAALAHRELAGRYMNLVYGEAREARVSEMAGAAQAA